MSKLAEIMQIILEAEKSGNLEKINLEDLQKFLSKAQNPKIFKIVVDHSLSLEEMINLGKYDWKNDHINSNNFQIKGEGKSELDTELINFNKLISSEDAFKELDIKGLRPATIEELLAFGSQHPEEQRKFPIVGLGSSCEVRGDRYVPYLGSDVSPRHLGLDCWDGDWSARFSFLARAK